MAVSRPKSGVTEYTATTGTGPLTLTGPAPGFRGFVSADDGLVYPYAVYQAGEAFETGVGTYTHATRQLSRTTIIANINSTTVPLNLGSGTKEVSIVIPGERVAMSDIENQFSAEQFLNGNGLNLDADQDSYISVAFDDVFDLFLGAIRVLQASGGLGNLTLIGSNDTATEGPELTLRRDSATPAASDQLFVIRGQGKDSAGTTQSSFKLANRWTSVTPGGHSSTADFSIASGGALQTVMTLRPSSVALPTGVSLYTAGKTATSMTTTGTELLSSGGVQIVCYDGVTTPLHLSRAAGAGAYVGFYQSGASVASIGVNAAGDVAYGVFTGAHYGDFAPGVAAEHDRYGTVLACTGALLGDQQEPIYELCPAVSGDRCVLGVHGGRQKTSLLGGIEREIILLFAVGNGWIRVAGPVAAGDLLWASPTPGIAEKQPDQNQIGPWTVAKATNDSLDDGSDRLISCIFMAG